MKTKNQIIVFKQSSDNQEFDVMLDKDNETFWASEQDISKLFKRDRTVIGRHIKNIFSENELIKNSVCAKFAHTAEDGKTYQVTYYNLDVIISVGYRVKSKIATEFRIWANKIIKDHLIKGYTKNENRLIQLKKTIQLITRTVKNNTILEDESKGLIDVLDGYTKALDILDDYDYQRVEKPTNTTKAIFKINYDEAINAIDKLRVKFGASGLFGNQKDESFKSSIAVIDQTFDGNLLYPSIEEKAANLLYLVVKNHSFTDGNKRIAAWLFVWYLDKNNFLYNTNGTKKVNNSTLVALTLMIAESHPKEKDTLINVIINLINSENE
ncbi:virulence protein RhuM/Fic/DOC family protein [Hwangdonia lutea]|uniref:Virulence protein RhuM/Fic/DOC family protein n=1 Tax=Hwangdonia lutea TaxID=3075823 RepID=A0AA97EKV6_9FLAO|nr:virulence protein RhuM/Fic/DOC family protein [Hwangdonia sp. SCSIO 19198]WOD42289.1 virulence protein RhuM/Fic/DOC family protein [Hwangdonia sp. SCSIO 19198]